MSFWGKLKDKAIVDAFGEPNQVIAAVPLVPPAHPAMPALTSAATVIDLEHTIDAQVGLPPIVLEPALGKLAQLGPRTWMPARIEGAHPVKGVSYLKLSGFDVVEPLDVVERVGDRLRR